MNNYILYYTHIHTYTHIYTHIHTYTYRLHLSMMLQTPGGFTRGPSGYACSTAKSGEKGSVLNMGQNTRVSRLGI
jgi:hypothetical protein